MTSLIDSADELDASLTRLARHDPVLGEIIAHGVRPPLRKREPGFRGLAGIIVAQQLSTASAGAIWARLDAALHPIGADRLLAASDEVLKAAGLSAPKIKTLRTISGAVADGLLPLDALGDMPAEAAHAALTNVAGIGPWTADIYLLFCLGHPDVFPAGDLALQEAARLALRLEQRPDTVAMAALALRWRPLRGAAAYLLWAFYARAKGRDGAPVADGARDAGTDAAPASRGRPPWPALREELAGFADETPAAADQVDWLLEGLLSDDPALRRRSAEAWAELTAQAPDALGARAEAAIAVLAGGTEDVVRRPLMRAIVQSELSAMETKRALAVLIRIADGADGARADLRVAAVQAAADLVTRAGAHHGRLRQTLQRLGDTGPAALRSRARRLARRLDAAVG
jgi:DNA-3-methyladenine glycosylase II